MTRPVQPCTFPHILDRAQRAAEPEPRVDLSESTDASSEDVADIERFAKLEFEPLPPDVNPLPSRDEWEDTHRALFTDLQIALRTLRKTKAELVAGVPMLTTDEGDLVARMVESLSDTAAMLKRFEEIVTTAELRWLCAAAVHATSKEGPT